MFEMDRSESRFCFSYFRRQSLSFARIFRQLTRIKNLNRDIEQFRIAELALRCQRGNLIADLLPRNGCTAVYQGCSNQDQQIDQHGWRANKILVSVNAMFHLIPSLYFRYSSHNFSLTSRSVSCSAA